MLSHVWPASVYQLQSWRNFAKAKYKPQLRKLQFPLNRQYVVNLRLSDHRDSFLKKLAWATSVLVAWLRGEMICVTEPLLRSRQRGSDVTTAWITLSRRDHYSILRSVIRQLTDLVLWDARLEGIRSRGTHRVGMQHSEEVGAGEELGAGGLEQQSQTRARAWVTVPPVLWAQEHKQRKNIHIERYCYYWDLMVALIFIIAIPISSIF